MSDDTEEELFIMEDIYECLVNNYFNTGRIVKDKYPNSVYREGAIEIRDKDNKLKYALILFKGVNNEDNL